MNRFANVILLLFIGVFGAKAAKVHEAWVNHFPQTAWINVFPDNVGHIAAVGSAPAGTPLVLLAPDGSVVASTNAPAVTPWDLGTGLRRPASGRVYVVGWTEHFNFLLGRSIFVLAYSSNGQRIWVTNYVGAASDGLHYDFSELPFGIATDSHENL